MIKIVSNEFNHLALKQKQSLPLDAKIILSQQRIKQWYEYWEGNVYTSFSGGKDSTVLRHLVNTTAGVLDVPSVFINTGLEYPEIQRFVYELKNKEGNIEIINPKIKFYDVISKYGYPVVSKEISQAIEYARLSFKNPKNTYINSMKKLNGTFLDNNGNISIYNYPKWKFLVDAPFKISKKCCEVLKKNPLKTYEKQTGRKPFIGSLASESRLRRSNWIKFGCNGFKMKNPVSNPMSFWKENDILEYIQRYNIPFCSIYGEIKKDSKGNYYTTGATRTGCMFCMFGCHLEKEPNRFQTMKLTHPNQYNYCMEKLGIKEVLNFLNVKYE